MKEYSKQIEKTRMHNFELTDQIETILLEARKKHGKSEEYDKLQKAYNHAFIAAMILVKVLVELNNPDNVAEVDL